MYTPDPMTEWFCNPRPDRSGVVVRIKPRIEGEFLVGGPAGYIQAWAEQYGAIIRQVILTHPDLAVARNTARKLGGEAW